MKFIRFLKVLNLQGSIIEIEALHIQIMTFSQSIYIISALVMDYGAI